MINIYKEYYTTLAYYYDNVELVRLKGKLEGNCSPGAKVTIINYFGDNVIGYLFCIPEQLGVYSDDRKDLDFYVNYLADSWEEYPSNAEEWEWIHLWALLELDWVEKIIVNK